MSTTNGAHILLFPLPAPGHIIPILDLTHLLLTRGLTVTVLVTPPHLPLLQPILSLHPSSSLQPLVLSPPDSPPSSQNPLLTLIRALGELHNPILQWFKSHPNPPVAIVSDFFLGWTHNLARDLDVPRVVFSSSGAFAFSVFASLWRDLPKSDDPSNMNFLISFPKIPNCPTYPWRQMSHVYRGYREGDPDWEFLRNSILDNLASWGMLFNSFTELERVYIDHLKKELGHDRIWAVGPLLPPADDLVGPTNRGGSSSVPPQKLMTWLDQRGDDSVVYVCFGTHFTVTEKQMEVLAASLECSGVYFVWCVKPDDEGHLAALDGFEDRVEGRRGLLIRGWAPQVAILRHRAVGSFVTHCGWNSTLEGLAAGVMMLTWPMGADQFTNAMLLVDQLGVGARASEGESVPNAAELTRLLIESVSGTRPKRARVVQLRDEALKAVKGGSSSRGLDEFVKQLTQ